MAASASCAAVRNGLGIASYYRRLVGDVGGSRGGAPCPA
jgi:hypothetical protein